MNAYRKKNLSTLVWHLSHIEVDMRMTEREVRDILIAYPGLTYQREKEEDRFEGVIEIYHNETNTNVILTGKFGVKIIIGDKYPEKIPVIYDISNSIKSDYIHRYSDGELCLESGIFLHLFCRKHSKKEFIDFFLINYLCSYLYYDRYLMYPNGERPHGLWGEYDFLAEYFNVETDKVVSILRYILFHGINRNDLCPCGSTKLVKRCHGKTMIELMNGIKRTGIEQVYFRLFDYLKGRGE